MISRPSHGAFSLQFSIWRRVRSTWLCRRSEISFAACSCDRALSISLGQPLDRDRLVVVFQVVELALGQLQVVLGLLGQQIFGDLLSLGHEFPFRNSASRARADRRCGSGLLGKLDLALDGGLLQKVRRLLVLLGGQLGELASQSSGLVFGFGSPGGDGLLDQPVFQVG